MCFSSTSRLLCKKDCILQCCQSGTFCDRYRTVPKELLKSRIDKEINKVCESCLFWKSFPFCPSCDKCPQCCRNTSCGRPSANFWHTWLSLGSNPRVISILQEGYNLPFKMRRPLTRSPLVLNRYANPLKNSFLKEAVKSLMEKRAVERVVVRSSLAFYDQLFQSPKTGGDQSYIWASWTCF